MNQPIAPGIIPPRPGLEREEPEQALEQDIPTEEVGAEVPPDAPRKDSEERPLRQVDRE
jgi:hypothetical protein